MKSQEFEKIIDAGDFSSIHDLVKTTAYQVFHDAAVKLGPLVRQTFLILVKNANRRQQKRILREHGYMRIHPDIPHHLGRGQIR